MTLEEAQAQIITLQEQVTELTNERDTLSQNNNTLTQENNSLRSLNQQYFNKLSAQYSPEKEEEEEPEVPSCEDFARTTLKGKF